MYNLGAEHPLLGHSFTPCPVGRSGRQSKAVPSALVYLSSHQIISALCCVWVLSDMKVLVTLGCLVAVVSLVEGKIWTIAVGSDWSGNEYMYVGPPRPEFSAQIYVLA